MKTKLIRLTTEDENAIFQNDFNENLLIKKNSEIAYQSISFNRFYQDLDISPANKFLSFQIQSGIIHDVFITTNTLLNRSNIDLFIDELELKMNKKLSTSNEVESGYRINISFINNKFRFVFIRSDVVSFSGQFSYIFLDSLLINNNVKYNIYE